MQVAAEHAVAFPKLGPVTVKPFQVLFVAPIGVLFFSSEVL